MNKLKRYLKNNGLIIVIDIAIIIILIYLLIILTIKLFDYMDKQHCLNMPFEELKEDSSCDEYWRDINEN